VTGDLRLTKDRPIRRASFAIAACAFRPPSRALPAGFSLFPRVGLLKKICNLPPFGAPAMLFSYILYKWRSGGGPGAPNCLDWLGQKHPNQQSTSCLKVTFWTIVRRENLLHLQATIDPWLYFCGQRMASPKKSCETILIDATEVHHFTCVIRLSVLREFLFLLCTLSWIDNTKKEVHTFWMALVSFPTILYAVVRGSSYWNHKIWHFCWTN
jgi:hypothetical protein